MATYPVQIPGAIALSLFDLADATLRDAKRAYRRARRRRIGETLRPGPGTPLWNELVRQAIPLLAKRGAKVALARQLGISRQRLRHCLKAQRACLDGERTLMLMCWVAARQQGQLLPLQAEPSL